MTTTYEPIATQTLGTATASVTFSSISSAFTDLIVVIEGTFTSANELPLLRLNSDTASNYSTTTLRGSGSAVASFRFSNQTSVLCGDRDTGAAGSRFMWIGQLQNYSNTTTFKTILSRFNKTGIETGANVHLYRSTSAITALNFFTIQSSTYASGTTFTLYGIKAE